MAGYKVRKFPEVCTICFEFELSPLRLIKLYSLGLSVPFDGSVPGNGTERFPVDWEKPPQSKTSNFWQPGSHRVHTSLENRKTVSYKFDVEPSRML